LPADADTNNAMAYYQLGLDRIRIDPDMAADAFYWASRIVPGWAGPLYARRVALLLKDPRRLVYYMERRESVLRSREIMRIDSLEYRARQLDPFLHRRLDWLLARTYLTETAMQSLRESYRTARVEELRGEVEHWIDRYLWTASGMEWRAWRAYSNGQFAAALEHYASSLNRAKDRASVNLQRGQIFYLLRQLDSAQAALSEALDQARQRDKDELVILYESKAMLEYSIGMVLEAAGKPGAAQEAYSRALVEDMAFWAAHLHLGSLALAAGDSLMALSEFRFAVDAEPNLTWPRVMLGEALFRAAQHSEAAAQLERAIELEPYYAQPYLTLGLAHEALGNSESAITCYVDFVARVVTTHDMRDWAVDRINALKQAQP
jgi:tetratricopeptide (TPR) repeat protein